MAAKSGIHFTSFPKTQPPPEFVPEIVSVFRAHEPEISTEALTKGLESNEVLRVLSEDLRVIGFSVETGKSRGGKIERPVYFGEDGRPERLYEIDGYHPQWRCGIEIEAGRGWKGNAFYRDLIQTATMVDVDHVCIAVANQYRYKNKGKTAISPDYMLCRSVAETIFGHTRLKMPFGLTVIGY